MVGKLKAFRRRFPNFWLATMIGVPMGVSLWLASFFFPYVVTFQARGSVNQCDITLVNGILAMNDFNWTGGGPPTNWMTLNHHLVTSGPMDGQNAGILSEEGLLYFLGLDFIYENHSGMSNSWSLAIWTFTPMITLIAWGVISLSRKI